MKIVLANETGRATHFGCQAVADAHARMLGRAGHQVTTRFYNQELVPFRIGTDSEIIAALGRDERVRGALLEADALVVNGEGTLHHTHGRDLLALLALAQSLGKATLLVNAVFQENEGFADTLAALDDFTVRESASKHSAEQAGGRPRIVLDSFFGASFSSAPARTFADRIVVSDAIKVRTDVAAALDEFRAAHTDLLMLPWEYAGSTPIDWRELPAALKDAQGLVTGRHHGVCAALAAGCPFVALRSNTWKIEAMLADLGLSRFFATDVETINASWRQARAQTDVFKAARDRISDAGPLTTFAALGIGGASREAEEVERLEQDLAAVA